MEGRGGSKGVHHILKPIPYEASRQGSERRASQVGEGSCPRGSPHCLTLGSSPLSLMTPPNAGLKECHPSPTFSVLSRDIKVSFLTPSSHCKKAGICRKPRKTKRALQDKKEKGPREKGVGGGIADGALASHPQPLTTDPQPSQEPHSFSFLRNAHPSRHS